MIKITIDYYELKKIAKDSKDNYDLLVEVSKTKISSYEDMIADKGYTTFESLIDNISDLPDFMIAVAKFEVLRPMKLLRENGMKVTPANAAELFSSCQVHLPGNELLKIKTIRADEDMCTDQVQRQLDDGWSILAICPQPSRRPDYIFGKS